MRCRGGLLTAAALAALLLFSPEGFERGLEIGRAEAQPAAKRKKAAKARQAKARKARRVAQARRARRIASRSETPAPRTDRRLEEDAGRTSGEVWIYVVNFKEEVKVDLYDESGELDEQSLALLDDAFRCKRTGEARAVDPRLYEVLSVIYDRFGKRRIELISGFRYQHNESSRHYHASAMDIRIPGVPLRRLWRFARSLDTGGMGFGLYPRSGFIHVDFRAPGSGSHQWVDRSRPGSQNRGKRPNRRWKKLRSQKPTS